MISLCVKSNNPNIINYLLKNIALIKLDNIYYSSKHFSKYTNVIVHLADNSKASIFYNEISNVICNCILLFYEPLIVKNLIYLNYFYFDVADMIEIEDNCAELLSPGFEKKSQKHFSNVECVNDFNNRTICLWTAVLKYITENKSMVLDGFVRFRIADYIKYIDSVIDSAVNQFVIDKEYYDFMDLLRSYINSSISKIDLVHLVYINGESVLLDKDKNVINISKDILNVKCLSDITFSANDYALNNLLSLLPSKLIIHLITDEDEFINTLKLIFSNRISICKDCDICNVYRLLNEKRS